MGYLPHAFAISDIHTLKENLVQYPANVYVRRLVYQYAQKNPHAKQVW
ncbi:MAG: hypothetical protein WKF89_14205 [Chitinophagaceae bacterium]